jgi:hypothetical protein
MSNNQSCSSSGVAKQVIESECSCVSLGGEDSCALEQTVDTISGVGSQRQDSLEEADLSTFGEVAEVSADEVATALGIGPDTKTVRKITMVSHRQAERHEEVCKDSVRSSKLPPHPDGEHRVVVISADIDDTLEYIDEHPVFNDLNQLVGTAIGSLDFQPNAIACEGDRDDIGRVVADWFLDLDRDIRTEYGFKRFTPPFRQLGDDLDTVEVLEVHDERMFDWATDVVILAADGLCGWRLATRASDVTVHASEVIAGTGWHHFQDHDISMADIDEYDRMANGQPKWLDVGDEPAMHDIETERKTGEHPSQPDPFTDGQGAGTTGEKEFTSGQ